MSVRWRQFSGPLDFHLVNNTSITAWICITLKYSWSLASCELPWSKPEVSMFNTRNIPQHKKLWMVQQLKWSLQFQIQFSQFSLKQRLLYTARTVTWAFMSAWIWPHYVTDQETAIAVTFLLVSSISAGFSSSPKCDIIHMLYLSICYMCGTVFAVCWKIIYLIWTYSGNFKSEDID